MKCPSCGWTILGKCANPDCKRGDPNKRPAFRPPMRTQRGHGAGGRVRMYRGSSDAAIENVDEQGPMYRYMDRYVPGWKDFTQEQRNLVIDGFEDWLKRRGVQFHASWADIPEEGVTPAPAREVTITGSVAQEAERLGRLVAARVRRAFEKAVEKEQR